MKEFAAAETSGSKVAHDDEIPPIDLQSLVDGIAALDRFDSVLADFEQSLEARRSEERPATG